MRFNSFLFCSITLRTLEPILPVATGSIGSSVLSVIEQNKNELNLIGISFNSNITKGTKIIEQFSPSIVHIEDLNCFEEKKAFDTCTYINTESELISSDSVFI